MSAEPSLLPEFPPAAQELVRDLETRQVLGASRHVRMILQVLCHVAEDHESTNGSELVRRLGRVARYFIVTRGQSTVAVVNALRWAMRGLSDMQDPSVEQVRILIRRRGEELTARSEAAVDRIARSGANLLRAGDGVMPYDYSSSVAAILKQAAKDGKPLRLLVPESRTVVNGGGLAYVEEALAWGHSVHLIADAAIEYYLQEAKAVLVGVERVLADGSFTNTVGTFMTAVVARLHRVPMYAPTELMKMDFDSLEGRYMGTGYFDPISFGGHIKRFASAGISFAHPDVDVTPPAYLTSYITEEGIIPPQYFPECARRAWEPRG